MRVDGYDNPSNRLANSECCDPGYGTIDCSDGGAECDNRFIFCLKPLGDMEGGTTTCVSPVLTTPQKNMNAAPIDFNQSTFLGLDNPLMLSGISTAWEVCRHDLIQHLDPFSSQGAQLYIQGSDDDVDYQELIDQWGINLSPSNLPVSAGLSQPSVHTGNNGLATLTLRFQVVYMCEDGTVCENLNECLSQSINCNHGVCVDGDGVGICDCASGYTGQFCEVDVNECETMNIRCSGNGQCLDEVNSYTCVCDPGYTGRDCEEDIDECDGVTCNGQGNCMDRVNGFVCDCLPGYTGDECETDINECEGQDCSGNGRCADLVGRFECDCDPGYTGTLCEANIDDCVGVNCSGNGQCMDGENNFTCLCQPGFTGDLCSVEIPGKQEE